MPAQLHSLLLFSRVMGASRLVGAHIACRIKLTTPTPTHTPNSSSCMLKHHTTCNTHYMPDAHLAGPLLQQLLQRRQLLAQDRYDALCMHKWPNGVTMGGASAGEMAAWLLLEVYEYVANTSPGAGHAPTS